MRSTAVVLVFVALACAAIACWMGQINAAGPFHRDGAQYLYVTLNMLSGQPPYWAQFDTKNPGVELLWAVFHWMSGGTDVVTSARRAESIYIAITAGVVGSAVLKMSAELAGSSIVRAAAALAAAMTTAYLLSDWRVSDNGFNTAIYQSLPEALCILAAWAVATRRLDMPRGGMLIGLLCALGWLVKQTSLVSVSLPLLLAAAHRRDAVGTVVARAAIVFAVLLAAFFAHLWLTDTWAQYKAGTVSYNSLRLSIFQSGYIQRFDRLLVSASWTGIASWLRWLTLSTVLLALSWVAISLWSRYRKERGSQVPLALGMTTLWAACVLAQALLPGTFFAHYWLALVAPVASATALFLVWLLRSNRASLVIALIPAAVVTYATAVYSRQEDVLRDASANYPQATRWRQVEPFIDMRMPVALWGGLVHPWVYARQPSHYPNNMWWTYIQPGVDAETIATEMRRKFEARPPRYVIEIPEQYPAEQRLAPFALSAEILRAWTGKAYCVLLDLPPIGGRYGGRFIVWNTCERS